MNFYNCNLKSKKIGGYFDIPRIQDEIASLEKQQSMPDFWYNKENAESVIAKIKKLKASYEPWQSLLAECNDLVSFYELTLEEHTDAYDAELLSQFTELKKRFSDLQILSSLSGEVDKNNCFISIHAGAGGTEACDWASMLTRMYLRWAEEKNFKVETIDLIEAEGGIKSISLEIKGLFAFGFLKAETGVHRLVRISPFDSNARRHTSFTSVYVFPVLDEEVEVEIRPEDLRVDTYRASGAGGQHINKTDSAVRITHLPTGIVAASQSQRSQTMNRATAMNMLKAKLYEYYRQKKEEENEKFASEKKEIAWGNQVRSYVFQPYTLVKDHRTNYELGNIQAVMDGDIDGFINAYLEKKMFQQR